MNMSPGGAAALVAVHKELLGHVSREPALKLLDADLKHLFASWFNRGFLVLHRIDWGAPAAVLEKLFAYEAVHEIQGWDDLRRRLAPDRRCFGFFHPALPGELLIFVEVALVEGLAAAVQPLLAREDGDEQAALKTEGWWQDAARSEALRGLLLRLCATYLTGAEGPKGSIDLVARFHLSNGARLERVNWLGNVAPRGIEESYGIMVNYLFDPKTIEANHEAFAHDGTIVCSPEANALIVPAAPSVGIAADGA
jgi:hypothetical protein